MRYLKIKILLVSVLIVYLTIRYFSTPYYNVDFPCFYELKSGILKTDFLQPDSVKDLIIFVSDFPEHASGGGCFNESVQKGEIVDYLGHKIELTDIGLLIDNKTIKPDDSIQINKIQINPINVWWIYHNEFKLKNHGQIYGIIINDSLTKLEYPRHFVEGYNSTKESFNFVTALVFVIIFIYLILLIIKLKKNKKAHTANTQNSQ